MSILPFVPRRTIATSALHAPKPTFPGRTAPAPPPRSLPARSSSAVLLGLHTAYNPHPTAFNHLVIHRSTQLIARDPTHPLHIRTRRRLEAFDPTILHWTVRCSIDVSRKATVRTWVRRRVTEAFAQELEDAGWRRDGSRIVEEKEVNAAAIGGQEERAGRYLKTGMMKKKLSGALAISVADKNGAILTASGAEVRVACKEILGRIMQRHSESQGNKKEPQDGFGQFSGGKRGRGKEAPRRPAAKHRRGSAG